MTEISESTILANATPEIAPVASTLLVLSMAPLTEYWMGMDTEEGARRILARLFASKANLFSFQFSQQARLSGQVAGLELSYPSRTMKALEIRTLLQFVAVAGPYNAVRMVVRSYPLHSITDAGPDEYFLAHLAVLPEFERRGVGRKLLECSIEKARAAGFPKITLTVDADNARAMRMYSRAGFDVASTVDPLPLRRRFSYHGYHHMTKILT